MSSQQVLKADGQMAYSGKAQHGLLEDSEHAELPLGQLPPQPHTDRCRHDRGMREPDAGSNGSDRIVRSACGGGPFARAMLLTWAT
jgi:hypothetical protein